jgi:hypothetical protein
VFAPAPLGPVGFLVGSDRDAVVKQVRNLELKLVELNLVFLGAGFELLDLVAERGHLGLELFRIVLPPLAIQSADLLRARIAPSLELLDPHEHLAPRRVDLEQAIERCLSVAVAEHRADALGIVAEQFTGEHAVSFGGDYSNPKGFRVRKRERIVPDPAPDGASDSQPQRSTSPVIARLPESRPICGSKRYRQSAV